MADNEADEKLDKIQVISKIKRMNRKYGKVTTLEIKQRDPFIPPSIEQKIRDEISKMRAITANDLAKKYDVRVSSMKKLLKNLKEEGKIELATTSSRLKVFRPV